MKIFILDTGCNLDLPNIVEKRNFTNSNRFDVSDNIGHGTFITKVINDICPNAELYIFKVMDIRKGDFRYSERALEYIVQNRWSGIVNCSFGSESVDVHLRDMMKVMNMLGITVVCAGGNEGDKMIYPASYPETISVGAIDEDGNIPKWSNKDVDIFALGVTDELDGTSVSSAVVSGTLARFDGDKDKLFEMCDGKKLIF